MFKKLIVLFFSTLLSLYSYANFSNDVSSIDKAIYGHDDRLEVFQADIFHQDHSYAVAGMVTKSFMKWDEESDSFQVINKLLKQRRNFCSDVKYLNQTSVARCSGFLVAPDILVTAAHCYMSKDDCDKHSWVFDYKVDTNGEVNKSFPKDNVYNCKNVIEKKFEFGLGNDYAVIQLDREVVGRKPLEYRKSGKIEINEKVFVIGHPSGLPAKVASNAVVVDNNASNFFKANLDTFSGNSGSPVFNSDTGIVEGILVRGETDFFKADEGLECYKEYHCKDGISCRGEDIIRITEIEYLKNL